MRRELIQGIAVLLSLALFTFQGIAQQSSATLAWDPNSESDLAGYFVYFGQQSGQYSQKIDAGNVTSTRITNLVAGTTYYFALTAYNTGRLESPFSSEIVYTVPATPVNQLPTLD